MQNQIKAEAHVLDRVMDLLAEGSVYHLAESDSNFAAFIEQIYGDLYRKAAALRSSAV